MAEQLPEAVETELRKCIICEKPFLLLCGSPVVSWSGCCIGIKYKDTFYVRQRHAHIKCFMEAVKKKKLPKLVKVIK